MTNTAHKVFGEPPPRPEFGKPETGIDYRFAPPPSRKMATCVNCMGVEDRIYMTYDRSTRAWTCESCEDWLEEGGDD